MSPYWWLSKRGKVKKEGELLHAPKLPIRYKGERFPAEFFFQDPATFLYNGDDMRDWSWTEQAPFFTEYSQRTRHEFMQIAAGYLRSAGVRGDYHEYGCFTATTFRMFLTQARIFNLDIPKFWAFDSFKGLPDIDPGVAVHEWKQGTMAMSEAEFMAIIGRHGLFVDRVHPVSGFFDESLTKERQEQFRSSENPAAFVTIDCDLHTSAIPVFRFIDPLLREGTLIYIDDYFNGYGGNPNKGVAGAFREFEKYGRWSFQEFRPVGWWGKSLYRLSEVIWSSGSPVARH